MTLSQTAARKGIDNTATPEIVANLKRVAATLEEVRALLGAPILVSSGYRSPALNKAIGGSPTSAHMHGLAADFTAPGFGTVLQVARKISASTIAYDQLIYEFGTWVHIGLSSDGLRQQDLSFFGTSYIPGIVTKPAGT
jgi:hypothetical protein